MMAGNTTQSRLASTGRRRSTGSHSWSRSRSIPERSCERRSRSLSVGRRNDGYRLAIEKEPEVVD